MVQKNTLQSRGDQNEGSSQDSILGEKRTLQSQGDQELIVGPLDST